MKNLTQSARKDTQKFLTSSLVSSCVDVFRTVITANLMGPYLTGLCSTLMIIPQVGQYFNLGIIESLTISIPHLTGKGKIEDGKILKNSVFCMTLIIAVSTFLLVLVYVLIHPWEHFQTNILVLLTASLVILWEIKQFFVTQYAIEQNFTVLSWVEFVFTVLVTLVQIGGVFYLGIIGFWVGLILPNLLVIVYSGRHYLRNHSIRFKETDFKKTYKLMPLGIILLIASVSYMPFVIGARIFIASTIGIQEAGLFVLSTIIISRLSIIPITIGKVLVPKMSMLNALTSDFTTIYSMFSKTQFYTFIGTSLTILTALFLLKPVVTLILPKYIEGIPAARMMLLAGIPYCLVDNANNVLLSLQYKKVYVKNLLLVLALELSLFLLLSFTRSISAKNISAALFVVFAGYALLANQSVLQLKRKLISKVEASYA